MDLAELLRSRFGHAAFRPHQEAVCRAVADGHDALLVMPTGAGKSLCYQLPAVARALDGKGGTALVVSPLIALMEDQVQKLLAQGFRAERIHSGRSREQSRNACIRYLAGELDFLFFAPERLGVPGFGDMLAKKTPSLVAVDEAHCISQWGHDFRPEYRMLGARLPRFRPAPVLALTATATPQVQDDIVAQLRLDDTRRMIHGFRRTNIAIEVVDCPQKARRELAAKAIASPDARPAILYAPTRKEADELSGELAAEGLACAAYHAGMSSEQRAAVQRAFLAGALEVVVATIAFGMGVDKPDVRSVVHLAMPSSVEAYSQEFGRAGRDGKMSRATLLCSWADRRQHEFFLDRDYPEAKKVARLFAVLDSTPKSADEARKASGLDADTFASALEKLWVHGGCVVDQEQRLSRGASSQDEWRKPYEAQRKHKEDQLDHMTRFADGGRCRMLALLAHFGDKDGAGPCGICDVCAPEACLLHTVREPNESETAIIEAALEALERGPRDGLSTGKLFQAAGEPAGIERKTFERLLKSMARARAVALEDASFVKDGERISFTKVRLLGNGADLAAVRIVNDDALAAVEPRSSRAGRASHGSPGARGSRGAHASPGSRGGSSSSSSSSNRRERAAAFQSQHPDARADHVAALKKLRLQIAQEKRIPAFRVLTDAGLFALAAARPSSKDEMLQVRGIGPKFVEKYGEATLAIFEAA